MGTSNLYNGPTGSSLLPDGYDGGMDDDEESLETEQDQDSEDNNSDTDSGDDDDENDNETDNQDDSGNNNEQNDEVNANTNTSGSWTTAKKTYNRQFKSQGAATPREVGRAYVKASGGYKRASRQAASGKKVTANIINLFSGGSDAVKRKLSEIGIVFEGRTTKDIFLDLYKNGYILPPDIRDNAIASDAFNKLMSDLFNSEFFTPDSLDMFDKNILEFMVCGYITHYIFDKIIDEISSGELSQKISDIKRIEDNMYDFVKGCVDNVVPKYIKENSLDKGISKKVDDIYDGCYKYIEGEISNAQNSSQN